MGYAQSLRQALRTAGTLERYIQNIRESVNAEPNINSRGARSRTKYLAIKPFSFDMPADTFALVTTTERSWTALSAAIGNQADDTVGGLDAPRVAGLTPAKIIYFQASARSVSTERSQRTGLPYMKYAGNNYSAPFGRGADNTLDEQDVFATIRAELLPNGYTGIRRVSHTVERVRQR